jgi:hypothetical protein
MRGEGLLMLDVARNTGRNMVATWVTWVLCPGEEGGGPMMLDVARNMLATLLAGLSIRRLRTCRMLTPGMDV